MKISYNSHDFGLLLGYGICGGLNILLVVMIFGQIDMLNASLKNLGEASPSGEARDFYQFRFAFNHFRWTRLNFVCIFKTAVKGRRRLKVAKKKWINM